MSIRQEIADAASFLAARYGEEEVAAQAAYDRPSGYRILGTPETEDHFALWRPVKVLAEVAAKRSILALAIGEPRDEFDEWLIRVLAAVYEDHPDYRQEWKP